MDIERYYLKWYHFCGVQTVSETVLPWEQTIYFTHTHLAHFSTNNFLIYTIL